MTRMILMILSPPNDNVSDRLDGCLNARINLLA